MGVRAGRWEGGEAGAVKMLGSLKRKTRRRRGVRFLESLQVKLIKRSNSEHFSTSDAAAGRQ